MKCSRLLLLLAVVLAFALVFVACGGDDDDDAQDAATHTAATTTASPTGGGGDSTEAATATATKASSGGGSNGGTVEIPPELQGQDNNIEACNVMTQNDVADAFGVDASVLENNSLGKQIPPDPFVGSVQCEWTNFNGDEDAWLIASNGTPEDAQAVKDAALSQCEEDEMVDDLGDAACYPAFTGQLRVVIGHIELNYFVAGADDQKATLKALAEKGIARFQ